jgi:hypothetical protein
MIPVPPELIEDMDLSPGDPLYVIKREGRWEVLPHDVFDRILYEDAGQDWLADLELEEY